MNGNRQMPTVEFGEGTTYDDLYVLLHRAKGRTQAQAIVFGFDLADGRHYEGVYQDDDQDTLTVALWADAKPTGEAVTFATDDLVRVVYL